MPGQLCPSAGLKCRLLGLLGAETGGGRGCGGRRLLGLLGGDRRRQLAVGTGGESGQSLLGAGDVRPVGRNRACELALASQPCVERGGSAGHVLAGGAELIEDVGVPSEHDRCVATSERRLVGAVARDETDDAARAIAAGVAAHGEGGKLLLQR